MKQDYHQLLKPGIINSISGLEILSKLIVEGHFTGHNRSRRAGQGLEFSQYRAYQAGDDMRLLDWKMLARSGRYYIKQSELDTHITIKFILDTSKSMLHGEEGLSKMDYVKVLVGSLAYLAHQQGDAIGLFAFNDQELRSLYPTLRKQHFKLVLHELIHIQNKGKWPTDTAVLQKLHDNGRKELLFFITDMYEHNGELVHLIKRLKTNRNEVVVLHIMAKNELDLDYGPHIILEDLETGNRLKVNAKESRDRYLAALATMMDKFKNELVSNNIGYHLFRTDDPIEEILPLFLKNRSRIL